LNPDADSPAIELALRPHRGGTVLALGNLTLAHRHSSLVFTAKATALAAVAGYRVVPSKSCERFRRVIVVTASAFLLCLLQGCLNAHSWVQKERPWTQSTLAETDRVRVEREDGSHITLDEPRIRHEESGDTLTGREMSGGNKQIQINLESIRTLEVRDVDAGKLASGIVIGIVALVAIGLYLFGPFSPSA